MTSLMALAWALDPSAFTLPAGQASPDALPDSEVERAGAAVPAGSEPQPARPSVPTATTAATAEIRDEERRVRSMRVLVRGGDTGVPYVVPRTLQPPVSPPPKRRLKGK